MNSRTTYTTRQDADAAAPIGHYVMFRDLPHNVTEWCVMSPEQRTISHAVDGGKSAWRTWARKEA